MIIAYISTRRSGVFVSTISFGNGFILSKLKKKSADVEPKLEESPESALCPSEAKQYAHFAASPFRGSLALDVSERKVFGGRKAFA